MKSLLLEISKMFFALVLTFGYPVVVLVAFLLVREFPFWLAFIMLILPGGWIVFWQNLVPKWTKRIYSNEDIYLYSKGLFILSLVFILMISGVYKYDKYTVYVESYADLVEFNHEKVKNIYGISVWSFKTNDEFTDNNEPFLEEVNRRLGSNILELNKKQRLGHYVLDTLENIFLGNTLDQKASSVENVAKYYDMERLPDYLQEFNDLTGVGGPSAGLALALVAAAEQESLTLRDIIVATGEVDSDGNVLAIGYANLKVIGAAENGARYFFCPEDNYVEALKAVGDYNLDIEVIPVTSIKESVEQLRDITQ